MSRAADDFAGISRRMAEINAGRTAGPDIKIRSRPATAKRAQGAFDVICEQPNPEEFGIVDAGGADIAIKRTRPA